VPQVDRSVFELVDAPTVDGPVQVRALEDLDRMSASQAHAQLTSICTNGSVVSGLVVEIVPGRFVDTQGLRVLLEISRLLRSRGAATVVVSSSRTLQRVLKILGQEGELPFASTVAEARQEVFRHVH
jgi:anti-anti-sigma factor